MKKKQHEFFKKLYINIANVILIFSVAGLFYLNWLQRWNGLMDRNFEGKGNLLIAGVYIVLLTAFLKIWGALKFHITKISNLLLVQTFALICANFLIYVQMVLMVGQMDTLLLLAWGMLRLTVLQFPVLFLGGVLFVNIYRKLFPPYQMLQINGHYKNHLTQKFKERSDKYNICEEISVFEDESIILEKIATYDAVLLNDIPSKYKNRILKHCFEHSVRVYFTPKLSDIIIKGTEEVNLFDSPLFLCKEMRLSVTQLTLKRLMDILISLVVLIITFPFMLITAISIKVYDKGPVFFKQKRCTYQGKVFWIYKFRSMIVEAEKDGKSIPAINDDQRITPVGKFIRKTRIDELPQLLNVLKGEMSIVGPRPERIEHIEKYCKEIPEFSYRFKVKGGLTGYAQVYGKYNTTAYDKLKMDLIYIVEYSFLMDIRILLETLKVIFRSESTEGFLDEQIENIQEPEVIEYESMDSEGRGTSTMR